MEGLFTAESSRPHRNLEQLKSLSLCDKNEIFWHFIALSCSFECVALANQIIFQNVYTFINRILGLKYECKFPLK